MTKEYLEIKADPRGSLCLDDILTKALINTKQSLPVPDPVQHQAISKGKLLEVFPKNFKSYHTQDINEKIEEHGLGIPVQENRKRVQNELKKIKEDRRFLNADKREEYEAEECSLSKLLQPPPEEEEVVMTLEDLRARHTVTIEGICEDFEDQLRYPPTYLSGVPEKW